MFKSFLMPIRTPDKHAVFQFRKHLFPSSISYRIEDDIKDVRSCLIARNRDTTFLSIELTSRTGNYMLLISSTNEKKNKLIIRLSNIITMFFNRSKSQGMLA